MTRRSASTYTASSTTEDVPPTTTNIRKMKTAAETFYFFEDHSRGITLFGGAALVLAGMVTITVQNKKDIEANKALIEFNRELVSKDAELKAMKNMLLYGHRRVKRTRA